MLTITQVDAFTSEPFGGNPAAVCLLPAPADEAWMQQVAREMNLSETAFLVERSDGSFDLRWFTPAVEVDLCGHATLASAHVLWEGNHLAPDAPAFLSHTVRPTVRGSARRVDRDGLPRGAGPASIRSRRPGRRPRGRSDLCRAKPLRLPRGGRLGADSAAASRLTSGGSETLLPAEASSSPRGPRPTVSTSCRATSPRAPASTRIR